MILPVLSTRPYLVKRKTLAFEKAKELSSNKGIINLGASGAKVVMTQHLTSTIANSPEVLVNVDLVPDRVPNFVQWDLEQTPYPWGDRQFSVCFASHILEHLRNWQTALDEMKRIADWVVIVLPHPLDIVAVLTPYHKQHFSFKIIDSLNKDNVLIYY